MARVGVGGQRRDWNGCAGEDAPWLLLRRNASAYEGAKTILPRRAAAGGRDVEGRTFGIFNRVPYLDAHEITQRSKSHGKNPLQNRRP